MKNTFIIINFCFSFHCSLGQQPPKEYFDLIKLADSLYKAGEYQQAAFLYSNAFKANGGKGYQEARYNAASAWAHSGNLDSAFNNLERIVISLKYADFEKVASDTSFNNLHGDDRWREILLKIAENKANSLPSESELITPQEIIDHAFQNAQVVMMNEAHSGLKRNIRTRIIGQAVLPRVHSHGVRFLAMEALTTAFANEANATRKVPEADFGYLTQKEMRELIRTALDLGWTLIPYEADFTKHPKFSSTKEEINWREKVQAENLAYVLDSLPDGTKLLVWCGNSHHSKSPGISLPENTKFYPMGYQFWQITGIEPFVIDQLVTVDMADTGDNSRFQKWKKFEHLLNQNFYGTLGYITTNKEAKIISIHNKLE